MNSKQRIFTFHLLNDRSGSPKVLSQLLHFWVASGKDVHLYTSPSRSGFLTNIEGVKNINGWYKFKSNPYLRLIYFTLSQLILMVSMIKIIKKEDIIYVNTVLPFGAAIIGKLKGCKVIYHIHESTVNPAILKWFLFKIVSLTADEIINVSKYVQSSHGIKSVTNHLVYNAIDNAYLNNVIPKNISDNPKNVLMVCSLKAYKGVFEFIQLAEDHSDYSFRLVLNATEAEIKVFFNNNMLPSNLVIFSSQSDLHPFYHWADVIVNLSRPNGWIETFGLTIIEGMAYGLPAIVPPIGGILEVIDESITGYSVDSRDRTSLNNTLKAILNNRDTYHAMSIAAKNKLEHFNEEKFKLTLENVL